MMSAFDMLGSAGPALLIVMGILALGLWLAKRAGVAERLSGPASARLEVVATRSLDPRTKLVLVRCDQAEHLLAVGPTGVTVVTRSGSAAS